MSICSGVLLHLLSRSGDLSLLPIKFSIYIHKVENSTSYKNVSNGEVFRT